MKKIRHLPELTQGDKTGGFFEMRNFWVILHCSADTYPQPSVVYRISIPPKHQLMDSTIMRRFGEAIGQARGKTVAHGAASLGSPGPQVEEKVPAEAPRTRTYPLGPAPSTARKPIHCLARRCSSLPRESQPALGSCDGSWLTDKQFYPGTEEIQFPSRA